MSLLILLSENKNKLYEKYSNIAIDIKNKIPDQIFNESISFLKKIDQDNLPEIDEIIELNEYELYNYIDSFNKRIEQTMNEISNDNINNEILQISKSLQTLNNYQKLIDFNSNEGIINTYKESYVRELKQFLFNERLNSKLSSTYLREVNFNLLSLNTSDLKWKFNNKIDWTLRCMTLKINRNFDKHQKASAIRDSLPYLAENNDQELTPFKRILDQNVPTNTNKKELTLASFHVLYITLLYRYQGNIHILSDRILFDGIAAFNSFGIPLQEKERKDKKKIIKIPLNLISFIFNRKNVIEDNACEIYTTNNKSYLFFFNTNEIRQNFYTSIKKCYNMINNNNNVNNDEKRFDFFRICRKTCNSIYQNLSGNELLTKGGFIEMWQNHSISTFTYIMILNLLSGRSLNDLSHYPIFPWVFKDYHSNEINLNNPDVYRDFNLPVGAFNQQRLQQLIKLYDANVEVTEKCIYRTHYSNAANVIGFMIRSEPFTTLHILLQDGKFDHADRLFLGIPESFESASSTLSDFRELIPQFYSDFHFLINENKFDLGKTMTGRIVNDVVLPNWASTPLDFIGIQRKGLESEYVSQNINNWIDLIFGVYRRSFEKYNVFHFFSYPEWINDPIVKNDKTLFMLGTHHSANFGICPDQILFNQHPKRFPQPSNLPLKSLDAKFEVVNSDVLTFEGQYVLSTNSNVPFLTCINGNSIKLGMKIKKNRFKCILSIPNSTLILIPRGGSYAASYKYNGTNGNVTLTARVSQKCGPILCSTIISDRYFATGGSDCSISIYELPSLELFTTLSVQSFPVIGIAGDASLDILVSVDENHQVYCSSIDDKRFIYSFKINCQNECRHQLLVTKCGFIVASSSVSENTNGTISIFDICGNELKSIHVTGHVVKMLNLQAEDFSEYIIVVLETKKIIVIDAYKLCVIKEINEQIEPEFVNVIMGEKRILAITETGTRKICSYKF